MRKNNLFEMICGSGFPAAIRLDADSTDRGWKAAPTIKTVLKILASQASQIPIDNQNSCLF
jgi:hypothetical protein